MLIGGALAGIVLALPLIVSAVRSMQAAAKQKGTLSKDEMPIKLLGLAVAGAFVVLLIIAIASTEHMEWWRGVAMAVLGTLWIWVAGVILSECIGRTNWSPLSGMTLIGITLLVFVASGLGDAEAIVASIMVGAAMRVAMSQATDLMMDLKMRVLGVFLFASVLLGCGAPRSTAGGASDVGCDCRMACRCQGTNAPALLDEARRAAERCEAAGTDCECPICAAP